MRPTARPWTMPGASASRRSRPSDGADWAHSLCSCVASCHALRRSELLRGGPHARSGFTAARSNSRVVLRCRLARATSLTDVLVPPLTWLLKSDELRPGKHDDPTRVPESAPPASAHQPLGGERRGSVGLSVETPLCCASSTSIRCSRCGCRSRRVPGPLQCSGAGCRPPLS